MSTLSIPMLRRRRHKVGLPPGAVVHVGESRTESVEFSIINYGADLLDEHLTDDLSEVKAYRETPHTTWINISGVHEPEVIQELGAHFGVHPLTQEDIANTAQRPKLELFEEHLYIVAKMLYVQGDQPRAEQVSLVLGDNYLLSFQEDPGDVFDPVRERLRAGRGRIRTAGPDYLAYALLDIIVDHYFVVLETLAARTEELEDEILDDPSEQTQARINHLRRDLIFTRRMTWPVRDLLSQLSRTESDLWQEATQPFVRDAYDHAVQVIDLVESLRDVVGGLTDLYMTTLSHRTNETMKVLTIIGTIFIPLTFLAGIYGMNFDYMPELEIWWAYPTLIAVMGTMALTLLLYFRRHDWI